MIIRELMDRLGQLDQEAEVLVPDSFSGFDEVEYIEMMQDPVDGQRYVTLDHGRVVQRDCDERAVGGAERSGVRGEP